MRTDKNNINIAIFASGRGSNFQAILDNIHHGRLAAQVVCVISDNENAGALEIARSNNIPACFIHRKQFGEKQEYEHQLLCILQEHNTELVCLAGYLKLIPTLVVREFKHRILNIHPALLPSFGGKGMYGHYVHEAVINYGCKISGATVHLVDEEYDTGVPIIQQCVPVLENDTPDSLAARVLQVEHRIYSQAIQLYAEKRIKIEDRKVRILNTSSGMI